MASASLAALLAARFRQRRWRIALATGGTPRQDCHLPPTIEAAEFEMALLLRRLRAHLHDPYDFAASRITSEAAFEECLERATALGVLIAEMGGAAPVCPAERERMRGLILEGLMVSTRMAARAMPSPRTEEGGRAAEGASGPVRGPGPVSGPRRPPAVDGSGKQAGFLCLGMGRDTLGCQTPK